MSTDKTIAATETAETASDRFRELVRARIKTLGISAREASRRAGFNVGYVGDFLERRSKAPETDRILKLADTLDIALANVFEVSGDSSADFVLKDSGGKMVMIGEAKAHRIPLYSARFPANTAVVPVDMTYTTEIAPLPSLESVKGAYAVKAFNDLSAPRFFPGEILFVSPEATTRVGDFAFYRLANGLAGYGRFAGESNGEARFDFLNPGTDGPSAGYPMTELSALHRIVGSAE